MASLIDITFECNRCSYRLKEERELPFGSTDALEPPDGWRGARFWNGELFCAACVGKRVVEVPERLRAKLGALWAELTKTKPPKPTAEAFNAWRQQHAKPFWDAAEEILPDVQTDRVSAAWTFDRELWTFTDKSIPEAYDP